MKVKLLSILLLFISPFIFSQTIKGKVLFNNYAIPNVDVVNANSKILTVSDASGSFSITVKANDLLVFVNKEYELKKLTITPEIINKNNLLVELILKPEELKEVVITKMPSIKLSSDAKYEQGKLDQYGLEKSAYTPKVIGVNMGTIENGMDFMRTGGMIGGLFKKEKEPLKKKEPIITFKDLAKKSCDQNYFINTLKLKPDEIELFLDFCDADPKSKTIATSKNVLSTMDFLLEKSIEFKKTHAP